MTGKGLTIVNNISGHCQKKDSLNELVQHDSNMNIAIIPSEEEGVASKKP